MCFGDITIQSKDDKEDFRSFAHVQDSDGDWWELRGYGTTAGEAAEKVCLEAVKRKPEIANYIKKPTEAVWLMAVQKDITMLEYVPAKYFRKVEQ